MSLFSFLFKGKAQKTSNIQVLDAATFKQDLSAKDAQLLDVRKPKEFAAGHIKKAQNADYFNQSAFLAAVAKLDKDVPLYVYCRSGNRSQKAARQLADLGFKILYDLKGGYMAWPNK